MAIRPREKKIYKWRYPAEKDDPKAMTWEIEPNLFEDSLAMSYARQSGQRNFAEFLNDSIVSHIKKLTIPANGKKEPEQVLTKPEEIDKAVRGLPVQYGEWLQLAINGVGEFLDEGLVKN